MWPFSRKQAVTPVEQKSSGSTLFFGMDGSDGMQRNAEAYAREGYAGNVVAYACIRKIASAAASIGIQLQKGEGGDLVDAHPLLDLTKHAIKQVDRLLSNPGVNVDDI